MSRQTIGVNLSLYPWNLLKKIIQVIKGWIWHYFNLCWNFRKVVLHIGFQWFLFWIIKIRIDKYQNTSATNSSYFKENVYLKWSTVFFILYYFFSHCGFRSNEFFFFSVNEYKSLRIFSFLCSISNTFTKISSTRMPVTS